MSQTDQETPRSIALMGLVMALLAVLGFVGLAVVMKMSGYGSPDAHFVRWTPIAVRLRQQGHWVFIVPLLWVIYAVIAARVDRGIFSEWIAGVIGGLLIVAILVVFVCAIGHPHSRPLLMSIQPKKSVETQSDVERSPTRSPSLAPQ